MKTLMEMKHAVREALWRADSEKRFALRLRMLKNFDEQLAEYEGDVSELQCLEELLHEATEAEWREAARA